MAEHVRARCQALVPLWKLVKSEELIPDKELVNIIRKTEELEGGIQKQMKGLHDFRKLIDFLLSLRDMFAQATKDQQKMSLDKKINETLMGCISSRFGIASPIFSMEMELWTYWIAVYLEARWYDSITKIYEDYTRNLGQADPTLWIEAGLYPMYRKRSEGIAEARVIMQNCLRSHPANPKVFLGLLQVELLYQDILNIKTAKEGKDGQNSVADETMKSVNCMSVVYDQAISTPLGTTPSFYIQVFQLFNKYAWVSPAHKTAVLSDIERKCSTSEETHDFIANQALEADGGMNEWINILNCFKAYEKGIKAVPSQKMYKLYLSALAKILRNNENPKDKRAVLRDMEGMCKKAHALKFLTREDYMDWMLAVKEVEEGEMKPKSDIELAGKFIPLQEWIKTNKEEEPTKNKKFRKSDEEDGKELCELSNTIEEVVDSALMTFPMDPEFLEYAIECLLGDPISHDPYAGSIRVRRTLQYLKKLGNLKGNSFSIYRKVYLYCIDCFDCAKPAGTLIEIAPQDGDINLRLAQEYLRFAFIEEFGAGEKVQKFLKGLQKGNGGRPLLEAVGILTRMLQDLYTRPVDSSDSDDSDSEQGHDLSNPSTPLSLPL